ncbi:hypothetical protein FA13DRAFT_1729632 [Coprinellus micaceus]|uniref:Uncharacterized protein n=1 Tax=Coprinellus micaceus TaxID=71717 RepID=A0A4Y7TJL5_COPMI|nr:hypothetical protein FA13DRAFT_1729632 [Coprinellus micaceus]
MTTWSHGPRASTAGPCFRLRSAHDLYSTWSLSSAAPTASPRLSISSVKAPSSLDFYRRLTGFMTRDEYGRPEYTTDPGAKLAGASRTSHVSMANAT